MDVVRGSDAENINYVSYGAMGFVVDVTRGVCFISTLKVVHQSVD